MHPLPASQASAKRNIVMALITIGAIIGLGCSSVSKPKNGSSGKSGGSDSTSDARSEGPKYPPMRKGSLDLAIGDAERGCDRLPDSERLYYCLQVASGVYDSGSVKASKGRVKSTGISNNANCRAAYTFYRNHSFSRAQAAGMAGNFYAESGCDPTEDNPAASGGGGGMAQWEGGRWSGKNGLLHYADNHGGNWKNRTTQLEFSWWELHNTQASRLGPILRASSPESAASVIMNEYERPYPGPTAHEDRRRVFARDMYNHNR